MCSSDLGGPYATLAGNVATNSYTDKSVSNGTTYYYVVSALNAAGESANSAQVSATPLAPPPAPTNITAARRSPSPNTVCVPRCHSGHARQCAAASRSEASVGRGGMSRAAEAVVARRVAIPCKRDAGSGGRERCL